MPPQQVLSQEQLSCPWKSTGLRLPFPTGRNQHGLAEMTRKTQPQQATRPRELLCPFGPGTSLPYPEIPGQPWGTCRPIYHKRYLAKEVFLAWWPWDSPLLPRDIAAAGVIHQYSDSATRSISAWETLFLPEPETPLLHLEALGASGWGSPSAPSGSTIRDPWEPQCHHLTKQVEIAPQSFWI